MSLYSNALDSILSAEDCAKCQFCCSFRRCSLWETPMFDLELVEKLKKIFPEAKFKSFDDFATIDIDNRYKTNNSEEEALCWFNKGKGCILGNDKPFECNVWPLRVMKKDNKLVITLSSGCKTVSSKPLNKIQKILDDGLAKKMLEYVKKFPKFVKDYREDYVILKTFEECLNTNEKETN